jgi:hypothetical protein
VAYLHLPAAVRAGVLARAAGALAAGGTLLVVGHDVTNLRDGVGGPQDPAILYTPETIAAELAGLRIVRAERVTRAVPGGDQHDQRDQPPGGVVRAAPAQPAGERSAIDTVVVAVRE